MKQFGILFLVFCLLFSLCACKQKDSPLKETTEATHGSNETGESVPSIENAYPVLPAESDHPDTQISKEVAVPVEPLVAVSLTPKADTSSSEDGTKLFTYSYQNVTIYMPDFPDAAAAISNYFVDRKLEADAAAGDLSSTAEQDRQQAEDDWSAYTFDLKYTPMRLDHKVLSFLEERVSWSGDAHPETSLSAVAFSSEDGSVLELSDILTGEEMAQVLCTMVLDTLAKRDTSTNESVYFENYTNIVKQNFELGGEMAKNWYLTDTGIVFYFSPDEIADSEIGPINVEFTYSQLRGIIKEDFVPKVLPQCSAFSFNAARKEQIQQENFDQVMTVTCDENGQGVSLFAGTTLYDVSVQKGHWTPTNKFVDDSVLFAANRLTEKDLLLINTYIPDAMPDLQLTANCGNGEERSYYIFQSGKDGSILLIDQI